MGHPIDTRTLSLSTVSANPWAIIKDSALHVDYRADENKETGEIVLRSVTLVVSGTAARIPSLKNKKIPGTNFINPGVMARLIALDSLYHKATRGERLSFGTAEVHLLVIVGRRSVSFDLDNVQASVRDWLEPSSKPVGKRGLSRGWGAGLVKNDSQITSYAIHAEDIGVDTTDTVIVVQLLQDVRKIATCFIDALLNAR